MSCQTASEGHHTVGVIPAAPWRLRKLTVLPQCRLEVTFNDGVAGIVDVSNLVYGSDAGVFEALRDPAFFARAYLDCGAVTWPNGADLAPDAMHKAIRDTGVWCVSD
jgi:hypothetical protein